MRLWSRSSERPAAASAAEALTDAIGRVDDLVALVSPAGEPTWCNPAAAGFLVRRGTTGLVPVHEVLLGGRKRAIQLTWQVDDGGTWSGEEVLLAPDGHEVPVRLTVVPLEGDGPGPTGYALLARDLSEQRATEADLARGSLHDPLTGLANSILLGSHVDLALRRLGSTGCAAALLLCDIDGLRVVNETLGRAAGDALLVEVSRRLLGVVPATDSVARTRGSEFAVVVEDRSDLRSVASLADRILDCVTEPMVTDRGTVIPRASIGVVLMEPADSLAAVVRRAELALQQAKYVGGDEIILDDGGLLMSPRGRFALGSALRQTFATGSLPLHFQPALDLRTGATAFAEALLRVSHPDVGAVRPAEVVSAATELGRLGELARMTLHGAIEAASRWDIGVGVAVNFSSGQVHDEELAALVESALSTTGLAPRRLVVEVREDTFLRDPGRTTSVLATLHDLGVRVALDGLGSGWPSLETLRTVSFDYVKVDRALLAEAREVPSASAVVGAVLGVAEALGATAVAGRIETEDQLDDARILGFALAQGNLIARPAASDELALPA